MGSIVVDGPGRVHIAYAVSKGNGTAIKYISKDNETQRWETPKTIQSGLSQPFSSITLTIGRGDKISIILFPS